MSELSQKPQQPPRGNLKQVASADDAGLGTLREWAPTIIGCTTLGGGLLGLFSPLGPIGAVGGAALGFYGGLKAVCSRIPEEGPHLPPSASRTVSPKRPDGPA
jgi:hypothetical protein